MATALTPIYTPSAADYAAGSVVLILPDAEFRQVSKEQANAYANRIHVSVAAIEGTGLRNTLVRAFLRRLTVVVKPTFPVRFFNNSAQAITFAVQCCQEPGSPEVSELEQALSDIRGRWSDGP